MPLTLPFLASYIIGTLLICGLVVWIWHSVRHWGVGAAALGFGFGALVIAVGVESINQILFQGHGPSQWLVSKLSFAIGLILGGLAVLTIELLLRVGRHLRSSKVGS